MIRVMFICHGNICRSPMAEMIFKNMVQARGLAAQFIIASSATSTEEIWNGRGNPIYPPAKAELKKHGIPCEEHFAVQLKKWDYDEWDYLICMDSMNQRNIRRIIGSDPQHKVSKLLDYTARGGDVADPWYSGDFARTFADITAGCEGFLNYLIQIIQNEK